MADAFRLSIIKNLLRKAMNRNGERWNNHYDSLDDETLLKKKLGFYLANEAVSEAINEHCRKSKRKSDSEHEPRRADAEALETRGTLMNGTGGGKRNVRSGKSMS